MTTIVINLFGGSNSGKSTTAAGLFYQMKKRNIHVELVLEYIKASAYKGMAPGKWDQPYIGPRQMKSESLLYGEVDYIITESPFLLADYYEKLINKTSITKASMVEFTKYAQKNNINYINLWLDTVPNIDTRGRFQTEKEIRAMSAPMKEWFKDICAECGMDWQEVSTIDPDDRINFIIENVLKLKP